MIFLLITLCTSPAMDDCQVHLLGRFPTAQQCEAVSQVHRAVLGKGPDQNYRLECQPEGVEL